MSSSPADSRIVILVAIDNTAASDDAIRTSALLGAMLGHVELHLLHVIAPMTSAGAPDGISLGPPITESKEAGDALLSEVSARVGADFKGRIAMHTAVGTPVQEILGLATDLQADVIVVGSHSRKTVQRWLLGSVSEQVVRKASCAVIVARPKDYGEAVPEIEPPCPECVATQKATDGHKVWCERHSRRGVHAQLHYEVPPSFAVGSTFFRPEG